MEGPGRDGDRQRVGDEGKIGRGYGDICIRIADSLYCTEEINTTL